MSAEVGERVSRHDSTKDGPAAIYPGDGARMERFEEKGASVVAICAGLPRSQMAFAGAQGIEFPLLAAFDEQAVEDDGVGCPERAYSIIASEGLIRTKRAESSTREQPEVVLGGLDKAL